MSYYLFNKQEILQKAKKRVSKKKYQELLQFKKEALKNK